MGVSAVEEHGKPGAFSQVKLFLKVSGKDPKEQQEGSREENKWTGIYWDIIWNATKMMLFS